MCIYIYYIDINDLCNLDRWISRCMDWSGPVRSLLGCKRGSSSTKAFQFPYFCALDTELPPKHLISIWVMNVGHCQILPIQLGIAVTRRKSHHLGFQYVNFVFFVINKFAKSIGAFQWMWHPSPIMTNFWDPTTEASNWRHLPWTWRIPWWEGWIHSRKLTKKWRFGRCLSCSGFHVMFLCKRSKLYQKSKRSLRAVF